MKNIVKVVVAVMAVCLMAGCKEEGKDASFKISGIDLAGVKYLALGSQGDAKGETQNMLYSIDEEGNMQLVAYEYLCDEEGLVTEIERNITITINEIVPVGERYIWLVGCRYVCEDYSGFSESMQDRIRGMVNHSHERWGENFLIRKSDGKIFDMNQVIGSFPICRMNVPGYGSVGLVGIGGYDGLPLDGDLTGDRLRKLGLINEVNGDIYLTNGSWLGSLSRLHDNGNSLSVYNVYPASIAYTVTDGQGHLGTCIGYNGNSPDVAATLASDGSLPAIQGIPVGTEGSNEPTMRSIGGKLFVSVRGDWDPVLGYFDTIYRVDFNGSQATATPVAEGYFSEDECETYNIMVYASDEECYTWHSCTTLYTFNSTTYELTQYELPAGWPIFSLFNAEGFHYQAHINNGLQSFTVYNLATLQSETVTCNRSQVPSFNYMASCNYDDGLQAFVESVIMADASTVTIVTPVTGAERGVSRVASQTDPNNNVEISTILPLN
ncbi:MAG: hypothetical protein K5864_03400 [Bacteroidales bacterium]|nr:hypothetical protein [Bacteroidales bacterium]